MKRIIIDNIEASPRALQLAMNSRFSGQIMDMRTTRKRVRNEVVTGLEIFVTNDVDEEALRRVVTGQRNFS
jgi:hypothetical protein